MGIYRPDPDQIMLQLSAHNLDGTPKTSLASAKVRVYHMVGASESEDLAQQDLSQVGSTNIWRYVWVPAALPIGVYYVEYALEDNDGAKFVDFETLYVLDIAEGEKLETLQGDVTGLVADVALIKQIETGRWRIDKITDQMIFYDDTDTPILTFDLKDINGLPSHVNIFERRPV